VLGRQSFAANAVTRRASMQGPSTGIAKYQPRQNRILAALPSADYLRLLPHLEPIPLPTGRVIGSANCNKNHVYFISAGLITRYCELENGTSTEYADTGREGAIGIAAFMGGNSTPFWSEVLSAGYSYRLAVKLVAEEFAQNTPLSRLLLRYVQSLIAEIGQNAACNRHHSLEKRLCRWLLSSLDRLGLNEIVATQELISHVLGTRRESITAAEAMLESAGLIHHSRGRIVVIDRARLEASSCECYSVVRREYARLLPENRELGLLT